MSICTGFRRRWMRQWNVPQIGHADAFLHFAWRGVNRQEIDSFEVQKTNIDGSLRCIEAAKLRDAGYLWMPVPAWSMESLQMASWRSLWNAIRSTNTEKQSSRSTSRLKGSAGDADDVLPSAVFSVYGKGTIRGPSFPR